MLKAMEQAFDDIVVTGEDWAMIRQSIEAKMMQGAPAAPQAGDGPSQPAPEGEAPPEEQAAQPDPNAPRPPASPQEHVQLQMAIKKLPPQAQQAIAAAVKKGVPEEQAFTEVAKAMSAQPQPMQ